MSSNKTQSGLPMHRLQCQEIWGGFTAVDTGVSVPGIDAWVLSRPVDEQAGGGDVHYVGLCGHGVLSRFVIADVAGRGRVVSDPAAELRKLMRVHMNTPDQSQLVAGMNEEFRRAGPCRPAGRQPGPAGRRARLAGRPAAGRRRDRPDAASQRLRSARAAGL